VVFGLPSSLACIRSYMAHLSSLCVTIMVRDLRQAAIGPEKAACITESNRRFRAGNGKSGATKELLLG